MMKKVRNVIALGLTSVAVATTVTYCSFKLFGKQSTTTSLTPNQTSSSSSKKKKILIIVALQQEFPTENLKIPDDIAIVYCGVGKVNATMKTFEAIKTYEPDLVINYGTVGSVRDDLHGIHETTRFLQRDIDAGSSFCFDPFFL